MNDLTIVITTYNSEKYINQLLTNLSKQNISVNIMFADDNSIDKTINSIRDWIKSNKDTKLNISIHENKKNLGLAKNRETIAKIIITKYILFLDVDDYIDLIELKKVYSYVDKDKILISKRVIISDKTMQYVNKKNKKNYFKYSFWAIWGIIFPTEIFRKIKFLSRDDIGEDINSWSALINSKFEVIWTKYPVYYHIKNSDSMTASNEKGDKYIESFYNNVKNLVENSNNTDINKILFFILMKVNYIFINGSYYKKLMEELKIKKFKFKNLYKIQSRNNLINKMFSLFSWDLVSYYMYLIMGCNKVKNRDEINYINNFLINWRK